MDKVLTDNELISDLDGRVEEERKGLAVIIARFREVERRKLYADYKYKSLFEMAVKRWKYSEDQAYARINAMKLVRELPEIKTKIEEGSINITQIAQAKRLFNKEPMTSAQKLEVFNQIEGKSSRESERITLSFASEPESLKPDRIRAMTETLSEIRFTADLETLKLIEEFRGLIAHTNLNSGTDEAKSGGKSGFADGDEGHGPVLREVSKTGGGSGNARYCNLDDAINATNSINATGRGSTQVSLGDLMKRALKLAIEKKRAEAPRKRRAILEEADFACENCGSTFAPEVDHIRPRAKGGSDERENLRCLCRSCNQRSAIREFGQVKMDLFM